MNYGQRFMAWYRTQESSPFPKKKCKTAKWLSEEASQIAVKRSSFSCEIKWQLLLGSKVMTNLDCIFKSRDITLPTKVHLVKAMVFPVVMYGYENWTIKKAEGSRIDAFELRCWRRLLRVPWTAGRSNDCILKEISTGCSLEGQILKLKLKSFGHLMWRALTHLKRPWCWERLRTGEGDDRGWDGWMASPTQWTWVWVIPGVGEGQGSLACRSPWGRKELDTTEQLNWLNIKEVLSTKNKAML